MPCKRCGSYAINHNHHGRDGSDPDLCDVCYWRKRAEEENEACAKLCESHYSHKAKDCAEEIRERVKP